MRRILFKDLYFEREEGDEPMRFFSKKDARIHLSDCSLADVKHPFLSFVEAEFHFDVRVVVIRSTMEGKEILTHGGEWVKFRHRRDSFMIVAETESTDEVRFAYNHEQAVALANYLSRKYGKNWAIYSPDANLPIASTLDWLFLGKTVKLSSRKDCLVSRL